MPIYDYRCDSCGHAFSAVQSFADAPLDRCPQCGARPRRLLAAPAIVFKGSGWYKTDSRARATTGSGGADGTKPTGAETATSSETGAQRSEKSGKGEKSAATEDTERGAKGGEKAPRGGKSAKSTGASGEAAS
jgi:putative FmdB family regulatory protein